MLRAVSDRAQQRQFPPPLEHVAQQDSAESHGAQHQAERAQTAECGKVRVLHLVEARQARFRRLDIESVISERPLHHSRQLVRSRRRNVQQEETVAFDVRKQAQEILLRDQQLALKKAVLQCRDDPETRLVQHELLAEFQV